MTKADMEADEKVDAYKLLAKQTGIRWHRVIGYIGTVSSSKGIAYGAASNGNFCWIYDDRPSGLTVIIR